MSDPRLRALPAVDRLASQITAAAPGPAGPTTAEATAVARAVLVARRAALRDGADDDTGPDLVAQALARLRPGLRRVLNATGVVVHTNLGRAPLVPAAARAAHDAALGYVDLELDLASGRRGSRDDHVRDLLCELTGAEDALVVNNGAAATLLAAAALAGPGGAIVVSRGELVEIGGGFRVPDVVAQAGARLVEVGTTNRTRLGDYEAALADHPDVARVIVMRVHQSNFRTVGFVESVGIHALCALGVPVVDDVGSGALADDLPAFAGEPAVRTSVAAGAALTCFSGDKLLGGPQAGLLVGSRGAVQACRRHPLARALRIGRLPLAALTATLTLYRDPARARREVPVLAMLDADPVLLATRARRLAKATGGTVVAAVARVGGGALPLLDLEGPAVRLPATGQTPGALAAALRSGDPAVLARIADGHVVLDPRTLTDADLDAVGTAVKAAGGAKQCRD
jgi:L-seryl-tRNA(Ser) seleniumtransferase